MIKNDDGPSENLNDFELTAAHLLTCEQAEKRKTIKVSSETHATIAESTAEVSST